ncbi:LppX_LprAFG lipoprotein [Mycobacterium attenuatum]|uniref:LppX_LprAFG lipoprotein n=1 Tax=Mycobacterium attenuatum TaxID=2341086 RepID=UPI000F02770F|nr:LppX_LprAFG lipoprotein [Mycobacterium attenuatum]VBA60619.1 Lipoprotein LprA [Mycobacterium attenuatum]
MKLWSRAAVAAVSAVAATALVLTGCSGSNKGAGGSSTPNVDAVNTVKQAADAMAKVTGMHVSLTVQGSVPNLAVTKLEGDVSNTPQTVATGTATLIVGKNPVDSKFVYVDGHLYSDVADPGKYADYGNGASIYDVSTLLDPNRGLAKLLSDLQNPKVVGSEQINGILTTKITGMSPADDITTLAGARLSAKDAQSTPTTVWIASDGSNHLVKLEITPVENGTVTMTMSDWGKQVTATKPA